MKREDKPLNRNTVIRPCIANTTRNTPVDDRFVFQFDNASFRRSICTQLQNKLKITEQATSWAVELKNPVKAAKEVDDEINNFKLYFI